MDKNCYVCQKDTLLKRVCKDCYYELWNKEFRTNGNYNVVLGQLKAKAWWENTKADIKKRRGQAGLDTLIAEMGKQRDVNRF